MGSDEPYPIQTIRERDYELLIFWSAEPEDPTDDNVDIEIRLGDARYCASVFTLRNVASLLRKWRATGEEPSSYFRVADAVVIDLPLTEAVVRTIVADAVATGDLDGFMQLGPEDDE